MAGEEERRSYLVVRRDGLILHTVPVTREEAEWLDERYERVKDRAARMRYLEEWGNVMDAGGYVERLGVDLYRRIRGVYGDPEEFVEGVRWLLRLRLKREARRALGELLDRVGEFLRRPVEPKPIVAPVRYFELPAKHVVFECCSARVRDVVPRPEWYIYAGDVDPSDYHCCPYGISVFRDSFWLWIQTRTHAEGVAVRRDARDEDVVAALAKDVMSIDFVAYFNSFAGDFRRVIGELENELRERGYGDVVRKAKLILAAAALLTAGRREEEGEALPA